MLQCTWRLGACFLVAYFIPAARGGLSSHPRGWFGLSWSTLLQNCFCVQACWFMSFFFSLSYLDHSPPYIYTCAQFIPFLDYSVIHVKQRHFWRSLGRGNTNTQHCCICWGQVPRRGMLALGAQGHQAPRSTTVECLQMCCWRGSGRLGQEHEKQHVCFLQGGENVNKIRVII